jgi:hypothetical protein
MTRRAYYSIRTGKNPLAGKIDLPTLLSMFSTLFVYFEDEGYFQEALGYHCLDAGFVPGKLGHDIEGVLLLELRKTGLTPIHSKIESYREEDLFDMIEFLYDHCAKPVERQFHSWNECGWHCETFERADGQVEYREKVNKVLRLYDKGYELSTEGEILELADNGLEGLFEAAIPTDDPTNIEARVAGARTKFRRYKSSLDERRDAIRDLADVLEYLRPRVKKVLTKEDETDLFNLANNFGIRHHNSRQKQQYDRAIWYSWMFYYYLSTIHAVLRLLAKHKASAS